MLIDIAFNAQDKKYKSNLTAVFERCKTNKIFPLLVSTSYSSSINNIELCNQHNTLCYVGTHPTTNEEYKDITDLLKSKKVIGVGECGLDYDRLGFCSKEDQIAKFDRHLEITGHPFFFHCRNSHFDFFSKIINLNEKCVVHSFTGSLAEAAELVKNGIYIGINGCSLKTENAVSLIKSIPIESIMLETDAPYCKVRKNMDIYRFVKTVFIDEKKLSNLNEPVTVLQIAEIISAIKEIDILEVENQTTKNVISCFGPKIEFNSNLFFN